MDGKVNQLSPDLQQVPASFSGFTVSVSGTQGANRVAAKMIISGMCRCSGVWTRGRAYFLTRRECAAGAGAGVLNHIKIPHAQREFQLVSLGEKERV